MTQEQIIRSFYDAANSHDFDKYASFFSEEGRFRDVSSERVYNGRSEIRAMAEKWLRALPDMKYQVGNVIGSGDALCVELSLAGTHKGPLEGTQGTIAATGKKVNVPTCDVIHLKNGKIESLSCYFAATQLLQQIGVVPMQRAA